MKKDCDIKNCRLNKVGGQAVLEGVMMKAGERTVTSCRKEDGTITVTDAKFVSVRKKNKFLNLPIIRGFVNFIEMMKLSVQTLEISAEALDLETDKEKARKEKAKASGKSAVGTVDIVMILGVVLGLALAVGLFFVLPSLIADGIEWLVQELFGAPSFNITLIALIEGIVKIGIFLLYLALVVLMPDIRRTFMYHGAEHKSIACFEAGEELTPENARKHKRFHPRCGTSFMFLMIAIGIFVGMFVRFILPEKDAFLYDWLYSLTVSGIKILLLPITMGIGYEVLMLAGKHDNVFTRIISAPGMWVQRLTTKEPTDDMLEVAIISIKCALRDEYPEYMEFYLNKGWRTEEEKAKDAAEEVTDTDESEESTDEAELAEDTAADPAEINTPTEPIEIDTHAEPNEADTPAEPTEEAVADTAEENGEDDDA